MSVRIEAGPEDAADRKRRRQDRGAARKAERQRVLALAEASREPPPSELVKSYQVRAGRERARAEKQRGLAMVATAYRTKREYLATARKAEDEAKRLDREAQKARQRQLDAQWATVTDAEIASLAEGRGEALTLDTTEVPEWVRDENGALAKDAEGMPILRTERAKARRRITGLELLREKGRRAKARGEIAGISEIAYEVGIWYGQLCADSDIAGIGGREETGIPSPAACKPSPGPADWKLEAAKAKKRAEFAVLSVFPRSDGEAMIRLLVSVCYDGESVHHLAGEDVHKMHRMEGRIATGLAILRHHRNTPRPRDTQAEA